MSNQPVNLAYLIESSLNDEEYIRMMIEVYIKNTPEYLRSFHALALGNDFEELKKTAHKFKASLAIMGVEKAKNIIQELETSAGNNQEKTLGLIDQLENYCNESIIYLKTKLDSNDSFCD